MNRTITARIMMPLLSSPAPMELAASHLIKNGVGHMMAVRGVKLEILCDRLGETRNPLYYGNVSVHRSSYGAWRKHQHGYRSAISSACRCVGAFAREKFGKEAMPQGRRRRVNPRIGTRHSSEWDGAADNSSTRSSGASAGTLHSLREVPGGARIGHCGLHVSTGTAPSVATAIFSATFRDGLLRSPSLSWVMYPRETPADLANSASVTLALAM